MKHFVNKYVKVHIFYYPCDLPCEAEYYKCKPKAFFLLHNKISFVFDFLLLLSLIIYHFLLLIAISFEINSSIILSKLKLDQSLVFVIIRHNKKCFLLTKGEKKQHKKRRFRTSEKFLIKFAEFSEKLYKNPLKSVDKDNLMQYNSSCKIYMTDGFAQE